LLSLILPAFNEARRLPASLARCAEFFRARGLAAEIIVADDGSTDGTGAAYASAVDSLSRTQLTYRYLDLERRGKGCAVRAGVEAASGDPIVVLDADLGAPVETIDVFLRALQDGADLAVASRGGAMYTAEAAKHLFRRSTLEGFTLDAEILFIARLRGYRVVEVPALGKRPRTRIASLRDAPGTLRDLLRIRWNALRGRYA
jgi:glycosyltransferase involved in cell wall biosynthesis